MRFLNKMTKSTILLLKFSDSIKGLIGNPLWHRVDILSTTTNTSCTFSESQADVKRRVPITEDDFKSMRILRPSQPENPLCLKVSILGEPNAGKSTLTNSLVKWKVCAVSKKVHTTRKRATAVLVHENKQVIFLDTPGFVTPEKTKRHSLEPTFVMDPLRSIREAHLIAVVVDISNKFANNRISPDILEVLSDFKEKKSVLILNKIDAMKSKDRILSLTRILTEGTMGGSACEEEKKLTVKEIVERTNHGEVAKLEGDAGHTEHKRGWPFFDRVFMVSALKNDGIQDLRDYLFSEVVPGRWTYDDSVVTDQHPHEMALMTVREKLLEYLPEEIPYSVDLRIAKWEILSTGCPKIDIKIVCSNSRHKRFVIGPGGKHIAACVEKSRHALRETFRKDVVLNLGVV